MNYWTILLTVIILFRFKSDSGNQNANNSSIGLEELKKSQETNNLAGKATDNLTQSITKIAFWLCMQQNLDDAKCLVKCFMEKAKVIDEDGDLTEKGLTFYIENLKPELRLMIIKECFLIKVKTCEQAVELLECIGEVYTLYQGLPPEKIKKLFV